MATAFIHNATRKDRLERSLQAPGADRYRS